MSVKSSVVMRIIFVTVFWNIFHQMSSSFPSVISSTGDMLQRKWAMMMMMTESLIITIVCCH